MKNRYDQLEAERFINRYHEFPEDLAAQAYFTRLLGADPELVMHGGGNTSVKIAGDRRPAATVLYVKARGADMAVIDPSGFCPLDLNALRVLRERDELSDQEMESRLLDASINPSGPLPSIETLLHAFLPHKYIHHTHAQSILTMASLPEGHVLLRENLGPRVIVLPLVMSGFPLAKSIYTALKGQPDAEAVIIVDHGIFTFHERVLTAYNRMIRYVEEAEEFLQWRLRRKAVFNKAPRKTVGHEARDGSGPVNGLTHVSAVPDQDPPPALLLSDFEENFALRVAQILRGRAALHNASGGFRSLLRRQTVIRDNPELAAATLDEDVETICQSGVITPDHVIWTKNRYAFLELKSNLYDSTIKRKMDAVLGRFKKDYAGYLGLHREEIERLHIDLTPNVLVVPGVGLIGLAHTRKEAVMAADIAEITIKERLKALDLGGFVPIPDEMIRGAELWAPERKKLNASRQALSGYSVILLGSSLDLLEKTGRRYLDRGAEVVLIGPLSLLGMAELGDELIGQYGKERVAYITFDQDDPDWPQRALSEAFTFSTGVDVLCLLFHHMEEKAFYDGLRYLKPVFRRQATGALVNILHEGAGIDDKRQKTDFFEDLARLGVRVRFIPYGRAVDDASEGDITGGTG